MSKYSKKWWKLLKIDNIDRESLHIFLNDLRDFNEVFKKDVTHGNIESDKKGFAISLGDAFMGKPQGWEV